MLLLLLLLSKLTTAPHSSDTSRHVGGYHYKYTQSMQGQGIVVVRIDISRDPSILRLICNKGFILFTTYICLYHLSK
jgi:hypothetical protein